MSDKRKVTDPTLDDLAVVVAYLEIAVRYAALGNIKEANALVQTVHETTEARFGSALKDKVLQELSKIAKKTVLSTPTFSRHRDS